MDKFYRLERYLVGKNDDFLLTFKELENILGFDLSNSAYKYTAYWSPSETHTMAVVVLEKGYRMYPDLSALTVKFVKVGKKPNALSSPQVVHKVEKNESSFTVDGIEYHMVRNPYTNGPMIARVDGFDIENRKEICRIILLANGWTKAMFGDKITNELERQVSKLLNGEIKLVVHNHQENNNEPKRILTAIKGKKVDIIKYVDKFYGIYHADKNGRYMSYDHIRSTFLKYRKDETKRDLITLHLYAYLASWGMLRNSFLMQKDYLFSRPIVDVLCSDKYDSLINFNPFGEVTNQDIRLIQEVAFLIRNNYVGKKYFSEGSEELKTIDNVTDTLVSKIMLGTLGCTVAYDRYVKQGLASLNMTQKMGSQSIKELCAFAKANEEEIKEEISKLNDLYTPMKIIDMYFFEKGFEEEGK